MKRVVVSDDFDEIEIWPSESFIRYREIVEKEVKLFSIDGTNLTRVSCPACGSDKRRNGFDKFGLEYVECLECNTLYISLRPKKDIIDKHFKESEASEFWHSNVVKQTLKERIGHLFKPRAMWVANLTEQYCDEPSTFVDINSVYSEFLEAIDRLDLFKDKIIIEPLSENVKSFDERDGFRIIDKSFTDSSLGELGADAVTAFAVIDHVFNPEDFLNTSRSLLSEDGILFFTVRTISGFDLQVLWENSEAIFPPDHLNLLSIEGIELLMERCGFEILELSTPGQLDVELVLNAMEDDNKLEVPRFISYFLKNRDKDARRIFQEYLQQFNLSSHARVAARKR